MTFCTRVPVASLAPPSRRGKFRYVDRKSYTIKCEKNKPYAVFTLFSLQAVSDVTVETHRGKCEDLSTKRDMLWRD